MPIAASTGGKTAAVFEIKSANLPLVALVLKSADTRAVIDALQARFADTPDFFDNDPLVIDCGALPAAEHDAPIDFAALLAALRRLRTAPVAVRGAGDAQLAEAIAAGLATAGDAVIVPMPNTAPSRHESPSTPRPPAVAGAPRVIHAPAPMPTSAPAPLSPTPLPESAPAGALVIDRPLRSGQQVYARGRDLVVMSMVNAGAEVIADGHIHVYAPLRGRVIAGARGDTSARIFALSLEAELISIAGVYRTSEVPLAPEVQARPAEVRLVGGADGKLVITPLSD